MINGGAFVVPAALGNKIIRPFSDFALHNIGTSAGIGGEPGVNDRFATTTIALWGVRTKNRFMMQGNTMTIFDSIQVHGGQAATCEKQLQQRVEQYPEGATHRVRIVALTSVGATCEALARAVFFQRLVWQIAGRASVSGGLTCLAKLMSEDCYHCL